MQNVVVDQVLDPGTRVTVAMGDSWNLDAGNEFFVRYFRYVMIAFSMNLRYVMIAFLWHLSRYITAGCIIVQAKGRSRDVLGVQSALCFQHHFGND